MIPFLGFVCRILFGVVFLIAAVRKASNIAPFAHTIYRIGLRENLSLGVAWIIIVYEATLGVLFVLGIFPFIAIGLALLLLALFIGVSIRAIKLHQKVRCNCFGRSHSLLGTRTLQQALLLLLPVGGYYLSTFFIVSAWWPTSFEMIISSLSLVAAGILTGQWLLTAQSIRDLVLSRQQSDREIVDKRTQELLQQNV